MRQIRSALPAPRRTLDRRIIGTTAEVASQVAILRDTNRLVAMSKPRQMPAGDPRVWVTVRFLDHTQSAPSAPVARQVRRRWPLAAAGAAGGGTVLGVAAYALIQLVNAVIAALPVIGGGLLLLALAAVVARSRSARTFTFTGTGRMD